MINIKKYYFLPKLKETWKSLECNDVTTPYQQYDFVYRLWQNYLIVYDIIEKSVPVFFEIEDDNETKLIAPLSRHGDGIYTFLGDVNGVDYCDFIYAEKCNIGKYLDALVSYLQPFHFVGRRIPENSFAYKSIREKEFYKDLGSTIYVNIIFGDVYKNYYMSLSSSMRQNLRTAYNRASRDGKNISVKVLHSYCLIDACDVPKENYLEFEKRTYSSQKISHQDKNRYFKDMLSLYFTRHEERYNVKTSPLKQLYLRKVDFLTRCLEQLENSISIILFIDNKVAAFMGGFKNLAGYSYSVPRLSINAEYGFYSPGILMINEAVMYFIKRTALRNLDLGMGTEEYKLKMGGVETCTKQFELVKY